MFHKSPLYHSVRTVVVALALVCLASWATFLTYSHSENAKRNLSRKASASKAVGAKRSDAANLSNSIFFPTPTPAPGTVVAWGRNAFGQTTVPADLSGVVTAIAAGQDHTVALKSNGTIAAWGHNQWGQTTVPAGLSGVTAIAAGEPHTVALKSDGTVVAWGDNTYGETTVPVGLSGVTAVAAGGYHTMALKGDGTVVAWGYNGWDVNSVPAGLSGVTAIAAGFNHAVALRNDGTVVAWGRNDFGQTTVPAGLSAVTAIAAGGMHTVALKHDGSVVAWGRNDHGESTVPAGLTGVIGIAASEYHTVALKNDGSVVAWGANDFGQSTVPAGLSGVTAIAAGQEHTVALVAGATIPTPTLGSYPSTTVQLGANTTVTPDAAPTDTTSVNVATSTDFKGKLDGDPATGVVRVTDAHPAGTYTVTVTAFNSGGSTTTTFTLTVTTPATCNPVNFAAVANFGVGTTPFSVAVGDFNGDGKQDLATANSLSNDVSILLGDGAGSFSVTNFGVGPYPTSVAVGDFNGDGKQDLAVAALGVNSVSILLGDGAGSFGVATNFGVFSSPYSVAVGDFNGDGKQDLAVAAGGSNNVSILLGDGAGSFSVPTNFGVGTAPYSVAVGDFNGDGKQDLAVANIYSNDVSILLGDGAGSFSVATNFGVGTQPYSVAVGDFNGDGKQDLATANSGSNNVSILLGDGAGSFSAATNFGVGNYPQSIAVGDFNGDGQQDLAVANWASHNVSILLGDGAGSFSVATNFGVDQGPVSVAVGDFNADGKQDLATANWYYSSNNVSILLRDCVASADLSITKTASPSGSVATGSQITYTITVNNAGPSDASSVDVNDPVPSGTIFSSFTTSQGSCAAPPPGNSSPPLNCSLGTINSGGSATITLTVDVTAFPGATISNTATVSSTTSDPDAGNNSAGTSNLVAGCDLVVTNTNNTGAHSLRLAIQCANANPGLDTITFNIPGAGVHTIQPLSGLPPITDPVIIDGYSQPGSSQNTLANGDNAVLAIELNGASANASGLSISVGGSTVRGLVINRFAGSGIFLIGASGNFITGNFIGTDITGTAPLANRSSGVAISSSSSNTIGGMVAGARNVVSGNGLFGIAIQLGSTNNLVQGNFIGTNAAGTSAIANTVGGVTIANSSNNTIGGTVASARNVISGNGNIGVSIQNGSNNNFVQGNLIGTQADGTTPLPNAFFGVYIVSASNNTVGPGNTIVAGRAGVTVTTSAGGSISDIHIIGNTSITGGAGYNGVEVRGVANISSIDINNNGPIKGGDTGVVISANNQNGSASISGVSVNSNTSITGGTGGIENHGVFIGARATNAPASISNATVNGNGSISTTGSGNGVFVVSPSNTNVSVDGNTSIAGNLSGVGINGLPGLPVSSTNISVSNNQSITGGTGSSGLGVGIGSNTASVTHTTVKVNGNGTIYGGSRGVGIGTQAQSGNITSNHTDVEVMNNGSVTADSPGGPGIPAGAGILVGGCSVAGCNSANSNIKINHNGFVNGVIGASRGIQLSSVVSNGGVTTFSDVSVTNNVVIAGNAGSSRGINLLAISIPGQPNVISGNDVSGATQTGIDLVAPNGATTVSSNNVHNNPGTGVASVASGLTGTGSTIISNDIHDNGIVGVLILADSPTGNVGNRISQNSIFSNGSLGIDLGGDGVTPNDACDTDTGANNLQNFPVLTSVSSSGGTTTIQGTLNGTPSTTFTIEFFSNEVSDPSGNGEGQTFIGSTTVTTDGDCNASFTFTGSVPSGQQFITATATDPNGNTSEFSACALVNVDLSINKTAAPNPVVTGSDLSYTLAVNNGGLAPAANVAVTDNLPAQTAFKSISAPAGWTCATPAVGANGSVTCTKPAMTSGESASITIIVTVSCAVADGTQISDTATVNSSTNDSNPSDNSSTATVTASNPPPAIDCPPDQTVFQDSAFGATVNYPAPTVTDNDSCPVVTTCTPASGSNFPFGKTTVVCTATDAGGKTASCSFKVTVIPPPTAGGSFVIGDRNAVVGGQVTFWGAQWAKSNSLSGGPAPSSFKGFAGSAGTNLPSCGNAWSSDPGNSSGPPASIPSYIAVIVSSSITKSGSTIAGNTQQVVIVRTNPGYASNPGHAGTGTVVAVICP